MNVLGATNVDLTHNDQAGSGAGGEDGSGRRCQSARQRSAAAGAPTGAVLSGGTGAGETAA
eukprot:3338630-Pleurochrysis_carterae.AAC.1